MALSSTWWQLLQDLAAELLREARECCTGVSQAACGIYQATANALVIQHWWSLHRGRELVVIRNSRNAEILGGTAWRGIQEAEMWCMRMSHVLVCSYSNHSYVSHLTQAVPLIIKRTKLSCLSHQCLTLDGKHNKKLPQCTGQHWLVMTQRKILFPYSTLCRGVFVLFADCY